jgi:hypothetical protein
MMARGPSATLPRGRPRAARPVEFQQVGRPQLRATSTTSSGSGTGGFQVVVTYQMLDQALGQVVDVVQAFALERPSPG